MLDSLFFQCIIDTFTLLCYNILCEKYATTQLYGYTPVWALEWDYRKELIMSEVLSYNADIVCLQVGYYILYHSYNFVRLPFNFFLFVFFFDLIRRSIHLSMMNTSRIHFTIMEAMIVYIGQNPEQRQWLIGKRNQLTDARHFIRVQSKIILVKIIISMIFKKKVKIKY